MTFKHIIAVIGATSLQGGSVAKLLLQDGTFAVRAITRKPNSAAAKELWAKGAEVVKANSKDVAKAFEGAYGVFGVTNFWESGVAAEGEIAQGKTLVDATKFMGVRHFVLSTLNRTEFGAPRFESKNEVDDYLKASGVPRTCLYTSFYFENFATGLNPWRRDDGSFDFVLPLTTDAPFCAYPARTAGAWALAAFKYPKQWVNKDIHVATEFISTREICKILTDLSGKTVHDAEGSSSHLEASGNNSIPAETHTNFQAFSKSTKPPPFTEPIHELYPRVKTFSEWRKDNIDRILA